MYVKVSVLFITLLTSSCSLFGIQGEEGPKYIVIVKEGDYEIRKYEPYVVAKTTVKGDFDESSKEAFRILAGYIFGKNKGEKKIAMTSPVEIQQKPTKISMTTPVEMIQEGDSYTMAFSMPSKYKVEELPEPIDKRIVFEKAGQKLMAVHQFSWFSSQEKNDKKFLELREWLSKFKKYKLKKGYTYAGYNPPWTIPFLRRNEIQIELTQ